MGRVPLLMGVLNVTPDSFYDGGRYREPGRAVERGLQLLEEGADWIDVGGASTRPGSRAPDEEEELRRVLPVVRELHRQAPRARISVDSFRPRVAGAALEAGASGINDVTALRDPELRRLAAEAGCTVFLMHMLGEPATMQRDPRYDDVLAEVGGFLRRRAREAEEAGVRRDRIWIDPGIGFGKLDEHNAALVRGIPRLAALGYPVLLGASRKSFIGRTLGLPDPEDRLEGSLAIAAIATWLGVGMLRVHDVEPTRRVVRMVAALLPPGGEP